MAKESVDERVEGIKRTLLANLTGAYDDPEKAHREDVELLRTMCEAGGAVAMPIVPPELNRDGSIKGEGNAKLDKPNQG